MAFFLSYWIKGQVAPTGEQYFEDDYQGIKIIYSKDYLPLIPDIKNKIKNITTLYKSEFDWDLDDKMFLVLSSPNNQIGNGYATPIPYILTTFYPGGNLYLDSFATKSWLDTLLIHEIAHLYQLTPKKGISKFYKKVFNNNPFPFLLLPVWTFPNVLLPRWILEGNAVFNESRFSNGGRLYSGENLALFNSLLHDHKINPTWLINAHLEFPFGQEKYIVGGYFNYYLAKNFGIKKTNSFFNIHSYYNLNPLELNIPFQSHFGKSYDSLIESFLKDSLKDSQSFKHSKSPRLFKTVRFSPMSRRKNKIFFLISKDGKSRRELMTYNMETKIFTKTPTMLKKGKVFFSNKGIPYSAHADRFERKSTLFGLWNEKKELLPASKNKIVLDKKGNNLLYFDAKKSFSDPELFINEKKIGNCHSQAIFDDQENAYCFFQNKNERSLLKNNIPIFKYYGYYGKVVGFDKKSVYFIAQVKQGSSLFKYNLEKKFVRISSSDAIIDAQVLPHNEFLIAEMSSDGLYYKRIKGDLNQKEPPFFQPLMKKNEFLLTTEKREPTQKKEYSPLSSLQYNALYLQSSSQNFALNSFWVDPLKFNEVSLSFDLSHKKSGLEGQTQTFKSIYSSRRYLTNWSIGLSYIKTDYLDESYKDINQTFFSASLYYPFAEINHFTYYTSASFKNNFFSSSSIVGLKVGLKKNESYFLSYFPNKEIQSSFQYVKDFSKDTETIKFHGFFSKDLGGENYTSFESEFYWTSLDELNLRGLTEKIPYPNTSLTKEGGDISSFRFGVKSSTTFNKSFYFSVFPFSLRRSAISLLFNNFTNSLLQNDHFTTGGVMINTEILIVHLSPVRFNFTFLRDFTNKQTVFNIGLGVNLP
jgi:hypothetical protein